MQRSHPTSEDTMAGMLHSNNEETKHHEDPALAQVCSAIAMKDLMLSAAAAAAATAIAAQSTAVQP